MITCTHWLWMFWYLVEFCPSVKLLICLMAKKMDPEDGLEKKSQTTSMRLSRNTNTKNGWALQTNVINQKWEIEKLPFVFINVCCFIFQSVSRVQTLWIMKHTSRWQSRAPHNFIMSLLTKLLPDSHYRATARLWCLNRKYMALRHWFGVVLHLLKRPCKGPVMTKLGVSDRSNVARSRLQLQIACVHRFCKRSCTASCFLANR